VPVSPGDVDEHVTTGQGDPEPGTVPALYGALLAGLLAWLASELAPPPGTPGLSGWLSALDSSRARRHARAEFRALTPRVRRAAEKAIRTITVKSRTSAERDIRHQLTSRDTDTAERANRLVTALQDCEDRVVSGLAAAYDRVVNAARRAIGDPAPAIQQALDQAAAQGITGFIDSAGRRWSLETWVETTVRAHYSDAALAAYMDTCLSAGVDLVVIGRSASPCHRCVPWENTILSLGRHSRGQAIVDGRTVQVAGTLAEAREAGLLHPWCRHRIVAWIPGHTTRLRPPRAGAAQARAWRRYQGRTARAWDRKAAVALTPAARMLARARAVAWRRREGPAP
jgi:hypothetical protein